MKPILPRLLLCLGLCLPSSASAQTLFNADTLTLTPLWHRLGDFTQTLRAVETVEISADGRYVLSGSKFGAYLMLWRAADGHLLWERKLDAEIEAVAFSPDGRYLAAGDEAYQVTIWDLQGKLLRTLTHESGFDGLTWSPDGRYVAGGSEAGEVVLWDTQSWEKALVLEAGSTVNSLEFSADATKLIAAGNKMNPNPTDDWDRHGFVKAWKVGGEWEVMFEFKAQEKSSKSVRLSPDERYFAVGGFANQVKVFSFPQAEEIAVFEMPAKIEAVAFHPEGRFLLTGGHDEKVQVIDIEKKQVVQEFSCIRVEYIDFSPDGRLMATGHEDSGRVSLYLLHSNIQTSADYHKLSNEILQNKDLK